MTVNVANIGASMYVFMNINRHPWCCQSRAHLCHSFSFAQNTCTYPGSSRGTRRQTECRVQGEESRRRDS